VYFKTHPKQILTKMVITATLYTNFIELLKTVSKVTRSVLS